jgi:nucleoid-associated protein YgaU
LQNAARGAREFSGGPRISPNQTRGNDISDELSDDKFEGYNVAEHKHPKAAPGGGSRRISVIDVRDDSEPDERIDGFMPENPTSRRAVSKTRVIRPTDAAGQLPPAAGIGSAGSRQHASPRNNLADEDDFLDEAPEAPGVNGRGRNDARVDNDRDFNRPSRDGMTAIQRRAAPSVPSATRDVRTHRHSADVDSQDLEAVSDTYRVLPEDNFWKISRRQYGTARYFQALMRHNQDRVPDPQKLKPGTQISTPPAALLEKRYADLIEKSAPVAATSGFAENRGTRPRFEKPVSDVPSERAFDRVSERRSDSESAAGYFYNKSGEPMYRVGSDDTLTSIAQRHLGRASRWTEIYDQNRDVLKSPNDLTLGTVIRLPGDASRLSLVPENERRR